MQWREMTDRWISNLLSMGVYDRERYVSVISYWRGGKDRNMDAICTMRVHARSRSLVEQ